MLDIEIWSDYTCPYCYIGKKQLFQVLDEMGISDYKVTHRVYLLDAAKKAIRNAPSWTASASPKANAPAC